MPAWPIAVSNKVVARNDTGQFITACEIGGRDTMRDIATQGAELSRQLAPVGKKPDPRTPKLRDAISLSYTSTTAQWRCVARHAIIIEKTGSTQHFQSGDVQFFWEKRGRMWTPGDNLISHPPTRPQPYLRPAYIMMMARALDIARSHYPQ